LTSPNDVHLFLILFPIFYYAFYVADIVINKHCKNPKTYLTINKRFKRYAFIYIFLLPAVLYYAFQITESTLISSTIFSFFILFCLHYLAFFQIIGLAKKSVSMNILTTIFECGGVASTKDISAQYGNGKGFNFVKTDRYDQLFKLALVTNASGVVIPTKKGHIFHLVGTVILRMWNLSR
jgi:hypothetical protein